MEQNIDCLVEAIVLSIKFERCLDEGERLKLLYDTVVTYNARISQERRDAINEAAKHVPWSDGECSCGVRYYDHQQSCDPYGCWSNHIRALSSAQSSPSRSVEADNPDPALLMSMATRLNHAFAMLPEREQRELMNDAYRCWEEVVGRGFYRPLSAPTKEKS